MATVSTFITTEELLSLPEDGTDRWLIAGELRERLVTKRNRFHSRTMARVCKLLEDWLEAQPEPRGQVLAGEAGVILGRDPDTTVGIDVTYISAEVMARQTDVSTMIEGIPTLVVEILSPNDTIEDINEKIDVYLAAKVPDCLDHRPSSSERDGSSAGKAGAAFQRRRRAFGRAASTGFRVAVKQIFE